jgi:16S rRNA (cytosine967-C5)-methyltransferase
VALEVLDRTLADEPRPFDEAFQGHPALSRLAVRDRAFARLLVTTVLRRLGQLDKAVLPFLRYRPKSPSVVNMLRLGAAQILFLSTPAHAAVGETVRLAQRGHSARCRCSMRSCARWRRRAPACSTSRTPAA